jgi:TRAP-type C4-dicarboxylate transport system substrate-binding protein
VFVHRCLGLAAACLLATSAVVQAADYKLTIAFDRTNPATPLVGQTFAKHLETASNGRMKIQITGPETVPSFEQLQPVAAGVFDFGLTTGGYHAGTITAATVLDGVHADIDKLHATGMIDEVDKHYQRMGLKIVAVPYLSSDGFQIIVKEPVTANGDLKGRKLRATPQYRPILTALGAAEVVMPNAETYSALEKGVVDGAAWTSIGILTAKFYEVNKYLLRPTFGPSQLLILMNLNRWKALSAEDRKVVDEAARAVEKSWATNFARLRTEEEATLIKDHGMKITRMRDDIAAKANEIMAEGTWALAAGRNARMTEELRKFARSKGLIN